MLNSIQVKICCISSYQEAVLAMRYGASALGLVGQMPSGPGIISDDKIKAISNKIPSQIETFLLTSQSSASKIIAHHQKVNTTTIQMVDALQKGTYQEIKDALPTTKLVQVIHVLDENSIQEALKIAPQVDAILLDSGNPNLQIKQLGGTGRTHNWAISRAICEQVDKPVYLAGGLNAKNVAEAIQFVQPYGVDLCSGVRSNGKLDETKLKAFFESVKSA